MDPFAAFGTAIAPGGGKQGKALFDYAAAAPNQISIKRGQTIRISSVGAAGGWSKGEEVGTGTLLAQSLVCCTPVSRLNPSFTCPPPHTPTPAQAKVGISPVITLSSCPK